MQEGGSSGDAGAEIQSDQHHGNDSEDDDGARPGSADQCGG
jgi:hypothetical protein